MSWITTDTDVAKTIVVMKKVNSQIVPGYPKTYSILDAFFSYPAITENEWHKMTNTPRTQRINAFKQYVGQVESINVNNTQVNDVYRPSTETPGIIVEP